MLKQVVEEEGRRRRRRSKSKLVKKPQGQTAGSPFFPPHSLGNLLLDTIFALLQGILHINYQLLELKTSIPHPFTLSNNNNDKHVLVIIMCDSIRCSVFSEG